MIIGVCPIQQSEPGNITFLTNSHYRKFLADTQASAVILTEAMLQNVQSMQSLVVIHIILMQKSLLILLSKMQSVSGIHPTAVIGANCTLMRRHLLVHIV